MSVLSPPTHEAPTIEPAPAHSGNWWQRARQRAVKIASVGTLAVALTLGLTTAVTATDVATAEPAEAATVGGAVWPPQIYIYFNRSESERIGNAANTGFTPFVGTFCGLIPGGTKTYPIKAACAVGAATSYGRLGDIFKRAARENRCVRASYPVGFVLPNPSPYSRVQAC